MYKPYIQIYSNNCCLCPYFATSSNKPKLIPLFLFVFLFHILTTFIIILQVANWKENMFDISEQQECKDMNSGYPIM